jgi:uncharacterized delta-60 repeat protein
MKTEKFPIAISIRYSLRIAGILLILLPATAVGQSGTLDITFGTGGIVTTSVVSGTDGANEVVMQSDGKMVVVGYSWGNYALLRYNSNGTLDNTFGTAGSVTTNVGGSNQGAKSVALQNDGKIVVAGTTGGWPDHDFAVARYNINGTLDNSFGTGGIVSTPVGTGTDICHSVIIQSDGKIVIGGYYRNGSGGSDNDFALIRYNTNGTLDNTFGTGGLVTTAIGSLNDRIRSMAIQTDGRIVVAGFSNMGTEGYEFSLARYNTDGTLDNTFGAGGWVTTDIIPNSNDYAESIMLQSDGKIIAAGYSYAGGFVSLVRYNVNGSLDNTFGTNGMVSSVFGAAYENDYAAVLQSDDKIVMTGYCNPNNTNSDFGMIRYNNNGTLDNSFGTGGIVNTPIGIGDDIAEAVAIQSDGKIVLAGTSYNGTDVDFAVARYDVNSTGISTIVGKGSEINISPNPFSTLSTLQSEVFLNDATLTVYNSLGQIVKQIKSITGQTVTLSRDNLPSGLYFIRLTEENKIFIAEKLVIKD